MHCINKVNSPLFELLLSDIQSVNIDKGPRKLQSKGMFLQLMILTNAFEEHIFGVKCLQESSKIRGGTLQIDHLDQLRKWQDNIKECMERPKVGDNSSSNPKININMIRTDMSEDILKDNYVSFNQNDLSFQNESAIVGPSKHQLIMHKK